MIRVTKQGATLSEAIGLFPAATGVVTDYGPITAIDTNGVCTIGSGTGAPHSPVLRMYKHMLTAASGIAGLHGWPTGVGCVTFGHFNEVEHIIPQGPTQGNHTNIGPNQQPIVYDFPGQS